MNTHRWTIYSKCGVCLQTNLTNSYWKSVWRAPATKHTHSQCSDSSHWRCDYAWLLNRRRRIVAPASRNRNHITHPTTPDPAQRGTNHGRHVTVSNLSPGGGDEGNKLEASVVERRTFNLLCVGSILTRSVVRVAQSGQNVGFLIRWPWVQIPLQVSFEIFLYRQLVVMS